MHEPTAFDPSSRLKAKTAGEVEAPMATTHPRNIFDATEGFLRQFRTNSEGYLNVSSKADMDIAGSNHPHALESYPSGYSRMNGGITGSLQSSQGKDVSRNGLDNNNGDSPWKSQAKGHNVSTVRSTSLQTPPPVQRVVSPPVSSNDKSQIHTIPKLRFKGAMFSGNLPSPNSGKKPDNMKPVTQSEQPLDLSKSETSTPSSVSEGHTPQSRDGVSGNDDAPLDLTVKRPKRDSDDDVVFMGVQRPVYPKRASAVLSPPYAGYQQAANQKAWRPALQMRLKEKQGRDRALMSMYPHQRERHASMAHSPAALSPAAVQAHQLQHVQSPSHGHGNTSPAAFSPSFHGTLAVSRPYMPTSCRTYGSPGSHSMDERLMCSPRSADTSERNCSSSAYPYSPSLKHSINSNPKAAYHGYVLPAQVQNTHRSHGQTCPVYQPVRDVSSQYYKHPSQIPSPHANGRTYTNNISPVSSRQKSSHDIYHNRAMTTPVQQKTNAQEALPKPTMGALDMPVGHNVQLGGSLSRGQERRKPADHSFVAPLTHGKPHAQRVPDSVMLSPNYPRQGAPYPLHIDIPSTSSTPETRNTINYIPSCEGDNRVDFNNRKVLPKAQNCRSIVTGQVSMPVAQTKRRTSESSPPELSIMSPLPGSTRMTCPSPLPSPQMPILSPQKTTPSDGPLFASPLPPQSAMRSGYGVSCSDHTKFVSRAAKQNQPMLDPQRKPNVNTSKDEYKFRFHRGNPEVSKPERVPSPIPASDLYPPPLALASCVQRAENTSFLHPRDECSLPSQKQEPSDDEERRKRIRNKTSSPNMPPSQLVSMVNTQGAEVADMIAKLGPNDKDSHASMTITSADNSKVRESYLDQIQPLSGSVCDKIKSEHERISHKVPSTENLAAFMPTSDKYPSEPLVINDSTASFASQPAPVTVTEVLKTQACLENLTRTKSVTCTTCSTRVVPVANVNPMIQGKLATSSQMRTPTTTCSSHNSSPVLAIPACGYLKDLVSTSDIVKFKKQSLRIPSKLITVPRSTCTSSEALGIRACGTASSGAPGIYTTTVTTRPTPVSLPSRSAPENVHVTTQPVTPIKRGPLGEQDGPRFPRSSTSAPVSATNSRAESLSNDIDHNESASATQACAHDKAKLRQSKDGCGPPKSLQFSSLRTEGSGPNLTDTLALKRKSGRTVLNDEQPQPSSVFSAQWRQDSPSMNSQFAKQKMLKDDLSTKGKPHRQRAPRGSRAAMKKQSPLMRKVSRQVAQELEKHVLRRKKAKEATSTVSARENIHKNEAVCKESSHKEKAKSVTKCSTSRNDSTLSSRKRVGLKKSQIAKNKSNDKSKKKKVPTATLR